MKIRTAKSKSMGNDISAHRTVERRAREGGLLLVDKPSGLTSHDIVAEVRKRVRPLKVGHTGTLDPLATGLLVLCVGETTKIAGFIEAEEKQYHATALLGTRTDTQDITGETLSETPVEHLTKQSVREAASSFIGTIEQTPPAFSAVKVDGVRAYKRARKKENVQLKARTVEIRRLEIEDLDMPRVEFFVECSKGTYIRTLCSDLGEALGVGGCLESLRRLAVGRFNVADAAPLEELETRGNIFEALAPASEALSHMPALECDPAETEKLAHGIALNVGGRIEQPEEGAWAQALGLDGELLAIGKIVCEGSTTLFRPKRVLAGKVD